MQTKLAGNILNKKHLPASSSSSSAFTAREDTRVSASLSNS